MPQGAIPMAHTFPLDLDECSLRASPTWRMTPEKQQTLILRGRPHRPGLLTTWSGSRTGVDPPGEDPGSGGHRCFDQPFSEHLLEFRRQLKVLQTTVDGDQQGGKLQLPLLHQQVEQSVGFGVVREPDVLQTGQSREPLDPSPSGSRQREGPAGAHRGLVDLASPLELDQAVGIGGRGLGVFQDAPFLSGVDSHVHQRTSLVWVPRWEERMLGYQLATAAPEEGQT